jgi:hypothetical protein
MQYFPQSTRTRQLGIGVPPAKNGPLGKRGRDWPDIDIDIELSEPTQSRAN